MWKKTPLELQQALSAPFQSADIDWRVSATNKEKTKGLAVPYVTNRAIQNRLDDTVGSDGGHNDFVPWKGENAQLCGISIYFHELQTWITKWDGADDSDIESVKGGLSDSMKRAAVEWGIGRYLYGMTQIWVEIEQRGKGFVIRDSARPALDKAHDGWVQMLQQRKSSPALQSRQNPVPGRTGAPPAIPRQMTPAIPPQTQTPPQQQASQPPVQQAAAAVIPDGCYLVMGAILKPTMSGNSRTSVQLRSSGGQTFQAYARNADSRLAPGALLVNAQFTTQQANGVTFYILEAYQIANHSAQQAA